MRRLNPPHAITRRWRALRGVGRKGKAGSKWGGVDEEVEEEEEEEEGRCWCCSLGGGSKRGRGGGSTSPPPPLSAEEGDRERADASQARVALASSPRAAFHAGERGEETMAVEEEEEEEVVVVVVVVPMVVE